MSTDGKAIVIVNKNIILDGGQPGLNFIVLSNSGFAVKHSKNFDINCCTILSKAVCCASEINNMMEFIKGLGTDDIIIIVSKGATFNVLSNSKNSISKDAIKMLQSIGAQIKVFREFDNYMLITSKSGHVHYELYSPEPIYFPSVSIIKEDCRINPENIKYPKEYVIFNDKKYGGDKRTKCAMEAIMRGYNKFGIIGDHCIPMTNVNYSDYKSMQDSDTCIFGEGNVDANSMSGYTIKRNVGQEQNGVTFYDKKGSNFTLNQGEYEAIEFNRVEIDSMSVPSNYFVFLIKDIIIPFYGPMNAGLNIKHQKYFNDFNFIVIQKHLPGNAIISASYGENQICMTFPRGQHILHPKLFLKVLYVRLGFASKISLYGDIYRRDLIGDFYGNEMIKVKFPRVIRSIIVD
jgi:hypothetical protein